MKIESAREKQYMVGDVVESKWNRSKVNNYWKAI